MTWQSVARKDFNDSLRSRWMWVVSAIFIGLFVGSAYFVGSNLENSGQQVSSDAFIGLLGNRVVALLVPLIAFVVAYSAIVGERESGTIKLLMSLPHSRGDVVVGKTVGRSGVVAVPIFVGLIVAAAVLIVYGINLKIVSYLLFTLLTVALGVTFVSLAVAISAVTKTGRRAMVGTVALYFLFTMFWTQVRRTLLYVNDGLSLGWKTTQIAKYGLFIKYFNPIRAYETLVASLYMGSTLDARLYQVSGYNLQFFKQVLGGTPFYLSNSVVVAQFLLWFLIPIGIGYYVFQRADL